MSRVTLLPAFKDNYIFVVDDGIDAVVVDPGDGATVLEFLSQKTLHLKAVLITHHHNDHIDGLAELVARFPDLQVYAPEKHFSQIAYATHKVNVGDTVTVLSCHFEVFELAGHTKGHVAYYEASQKWLFLGDVLFGLGCGRIFDGTLAQQYQSLQFIKTLPADTQIFCAHEYTETNWKFLESLSNPTAAQEEYGINLKSMRARGQPSVPLLLSAELESNPFLLADNLEEFTKLRELRNRF